MKFMGRLMLVGVTAVFMAGCGKAKPGGETAVSVVDGLVNEAIMMAETGNVDGALAQLDKGLAEVKDPSERARLFAFELSFLLNQGRLEEAQTRYLKALSAPDDAELARHTLGFIEDFLAQQPEGHVAVLEWCDRLETAGIPESMTAAVIQNRLSALLALARQKDALALIETRGWALDDDQAAALCARFIQAAIGQGRFDDASAGIALVENKGAKRVGMDKLAASSRIDLALAQGQFAAAMDRLIQHAALFDDGTSASLVARVTRAAMTGGKPEESDAACEKALAAFADRPVTREQAARAWLTRARDAGSLELALDRLLKLDGMGLPPTVLAGGVGLVSQQVLSPDSPVAEVTRMMEFVGSLKLRVTEEWEQSLLTGVQLDCGFRTESFPFLVTLLEAGVPGRDAAWQTLMINKVKAHQALKEGNTDEAVKRFREFMDAIGAQEDQDYRDPVTDERVTKPMILGLNAKRIGDILAKAGRADEAAKAYAEAKADYGEALKAFSPADPEHKTITVALAELDQGPAGK